MPSTITYDATAGSDTAASGSGPVTAITGTSATNGAGNVVNLDGTPDLSGVAVNDVIWVNSATTNRHLSRITAVDDGADTITTEDLLVLGAGVSWAIGGERQTFENDTGNRDWGDWKAGWFVQLDGVFNITAEFNPTEPGNNTDGFLTIQIKPLAASLPEIVHGTVNERTVNITTAAYRMNFDRIHISNATTWVGGSMIRSGVSDGILNIRGCDLEGKAASGGGPAIIGVGSSVINLIGNYIHGQITHGMETAGGAREAGVITGNWLNGGSGIGIYLQGSATYADRTIERNLISNFTGNGISVDNNANTSTNLILHNTIYNCADGISVLDPLTNSAVTIRYNLIVGCSGWGITAVTASNTADHTFCDYNAFYNNTSGEVQNAAAGDNDITLTSDPFINAANDDFRLNIALGGGSLCKGAAYPQLMLGSTVMVNNLDIGALQHADPAGSGGGAVSLFNGTIQ